MGELLRFFEQVDVLERFPEHRTTWNTEPLVENGRIDATEIGVEAEIAAFQLCQTRMFANQT